MPDSFGIKDHTRKLPVLSNTDFLPPKLDLATRRRFNRILPGFMRKVSGIEKVEIDPADLGRLRSLDGRRLLLTPNHPTADDPIMMFALSREADMPFHYLAAREVFDDIHGLKGHVLQKLGAYSVVRGTADRESFRTTRELLANPGGRVVIFPEGEIYSQNDSLLPFQAGVVQLAFWAMDDLRKAGDEAPSVLILPIGIHYHYLKTMDDAIDRSLSGLEEALGVKAAANGRYERLRAVGRAVLETMEAEYGLRKPEDDGDDMSARMNKLKAMLLDRAAGLIGIRLSEETSLPERLRTVVNAVFAVTRDEPHEKWPAYRERLHKEQAARVTPLLQDLNRVANWIAVTDNYVRSNPTADRMGDNIRRLEIEVFGESFLIGPRKAVIRIGEPIDLGAAYSEYRADKRGTVNRIVGQLEHDVQALLNKPQ